MLAFDSGYYHYDDSDYVMWSSACIGVTTSLLDVDLTWWWKCYVRHPRRLMFFWPFAESASYKTVQIVTNVFVPTDWCYVFLNTGIEIYGRQPKTAEMLWIHKANFFAFIIVLFCLIYVSLEEWKWIMLNMIKMFYILLLCSFPDCSEETRKQGNI